MPHISIRSRQSWNEDWVRDGREIVTHNEDGGIVNGQNSRVRREYRGRLSIKTEKRVGLKTEP